MVPGREEEDWVRLAAEGAADVLAEEDAGGGRGRHILLFVGIEIRDVDMCRARFDFIWILG